MTGVHLVAVVRASHAAVVDAACAPDACEFVVSRDVAAAIGPADGVGALRLREVRRHHDIVRELFEHGPVLPFRFGTLAPSRDEAAALLRHRGDAYARQLDHLAGRVELTVTMSDDETVLLQGILDERPKIRRLSESARRTGGMRELVHLGEVVSSELAHRRRAAARTVVDRLATLVVDVVERPPARGMDARLSVLVDASRVSAVEEALSALASESGGRIAATLGEPLPPYSFVDRPARHRESAGGRRRWVS